MSTDWPPPCLAHHYNPETRHMLGPVKRCVEERPGGWVHTTEYGPDHKLIAFTDERDGKIVESCSESDHSETYDSQGRLLSNRSAKGDGTFGENFYHYDEAGRRTAMTNNQNTNWTEYLYDANGFLKTCIETFDPTRPAGANMPHAFLGSSIHIGVPAGGSAVTTYDERDDTVCGHCGEKHHGSQSPTEMRILTADGRLVGQYVRKYDESGRVVEEKTLQQNDGLLFLDRMTPEQKAAWPPEQAQAFAKEINERCGKLPPETRYKYDSQGHLIEKRERSAFVEQTTTIDYNDRGDVTRRLMTFTAGDRPSQVALDTHYSYQYDRFNNWTEKVVTDDAGGSRKRESTTRRTITYY
jgi:hypothetical protein